uniref:Uncharacterized protein n=1 Tax=Anopheles atroparvus TaxID=41427 RepID=A0AAG5DEV7_ANOAO
RPQTVTQPYRLSDGISTHQHTRTCLRHLVCGNGACGASDPGKTKRENKSQQEGRELGKV